jgi:SAM-dependent methyltransferase
LTSADARTYAGVVASALYEQLGQTYQQARRPDPRIGRLLITAIGDARSVINVGAGTGSYEPCDRYVVAVEPAAAMRARRPATAAPCIAASAEALPFDDTSIDVAMAIYTDFHWADRARGIAEMLRVARRSVVLLTVDSATADSYWLIRDYFPDARELFAPLAELLAMLPGAQVCPVMIPDDCQDRFVHAFWKRPDVLLDPGVRSSMALFGRLPSHEVDIGIRRLRADLTDGTWHARNQPLLDASEADLGHRLVVWTQPS